MDVLQESDIHRKLFLEEMASCVGSEAGSILRAKQKNRVLCVDDERGVLDGLRLQLRRYYEVFTATSGAEGIALLRQEHDIAVVISDMRMPGMDGAEFLRQVNELAPDTTRIMLTGQADIESAMRAINHGQVFRFLLKPCQPQDLLAVVAAAISRYRLACAQRVLAQQVLLTSEGIQDGDSALQAIFETACRLFDCRYAAMGWHAGTGSMGSHILVSGLTAKLFDNAPEHMPPVIAAVRSAETIDCIVKTADGPDGLSGLPPGHPRVTHLIGAAFAVSGRSHGWVYFADADPLTPYCVDDKDTVTALRSTCALICETAERHRQAQEYSLQLLARDDQLERLSYHDPLTGLATRQLFLDRTNELLGAARIQNSRLCVMLLDIRHFRYLNDTLGQRACDEVLKNLGERLTRAPTSRMHVARIGGDRFAMVIPEPSASSDPVALLSSEICNPLGAPLLVAGQKLQLTGTVGISFFPDDGDDADCLLCNAEAAMKSAKADGSNARAYTRELGMTISQRMLLENRLRQAIEQRQFRLYYQPKIDLRGGAICGAEALLRWKSPDLGIVPPIQFIPVLEDTGLILEVGNWVLQQAAVDRRLWLAQGLDPPPIAVNVSPLQLRATDFVDVVLAAIGSQAKEHAGISLEITESVLMSGADETIEKLRRIRDLGITIAIDDFGTGYSSLAYLTRLPVAAVKIDRAFITRIGESADTVAIVSAIITLARALNLKVIAEGVETAEQLKFLRLLRCDEIQGFLFSPGLPAREFAALLREGRRLLLDATKPAA